MVNPDCISETKIQIDLGAILINIDSPPVLDANPKIDIHFFRIKERSFLSIEIDVLIIEFIFQFNLGNIRKKGGTRLFDPFFILKILNQMLLSVDLSSVGEPVEQRSCEDHFGIIVEQISVIAS